MYRRSREALELIAQRFRALADPTRLALLQAMFERERTVQDLCAVTGASQANASKHLALLLEQGLVPADGTASSPATGSRIPRSSGCVT